jgi:hypothetical protein
MEDGLVYVKTTEASFCGRSLPEMYEETPDF